jgi:hypothetical protein
MSWLLVLLLTPTAVFVSKWISSRAGMLVLPAISVFYPFIREARISFLNGFLILLFWTLLLSLVVSYLSFKQPQPMQNIIWRSREYAEGMFRWIETAELPEGSATQVLLFHLRQTLLYCAVALFTANFLALLLGAGLLNYMNYYVASFARRSSIPPIAFFLAWNPWSVVRVLSFLWLGMVVSAPSLAVLVPIPWKISLKLVAPAVIGLILDVVLKLSLSRMWSLKLRHLITNGL